MAGRSGLVDPESLADAVGQSLLALGSAQCAAGRLDRFRISPGFRVGGRQGLQISGYNNYAGNGGYFVDLVGVRFNSASTLNLSDFAYGSDTINAGDVKIQDNWSNSASFPGYGSANRTTFNTDAAADTALVSWLNAQVTAGASTGDYLFFRL